MEAKLISSELWLRVGRSTDLIEELREEVRIVCEILVAALGTTVKLINTC